MRSFGKSKMATPKLNCFTCMGWGWGSSIVDFTLPARLCGSAAIDQFDSYWTQKTMKQS